MRKWPYTPKTSRDNWKTLKHNAYATKEKKWFNEYWLAKQMTDKQAIEEWLGDYYDWELSAEELRDYFKLYYWEYDEIMDVLDYQEWVDTETYSKLDFLDFDKIENIEDKKALKLLQNSRVLFIEENWKEINENTIIYISDKKANVRAKIILKDLFWYLGFEDNDLRKTLNLFIDSNHIIDLDINIKNRTLKNDEFLPKELKGRKQSPFYNWRNIA